ncbi:MAG: fasciclin domain-containing protein [Dysgonamonadaceae bacterium]|jgi:uncharacterized surface protein with fasciclin (FAS1) repeats|nr:fasciclin domain-containing protein [Dysgonamonadaceae bacterium]
MKINIKFLLCILCAFVFIRCNEEANNYYEKPKWLEDPIYQVLEQQGRFSLYLQCVDRTNYANILNGAGLYTIFAPNDEAFSIWLKEKSYASVADIPAGEVEKLVAYSIVYSQWTMEHLGDYFEEGLYVPGAFKRKTNYYNLPYRDNEYNNNWVIDQTVQNGYSADMNNYKYLPVYTSAYFNTFPVALTAADYIAFYPYSTFAGKNVQAGTILTEDIRTSNGIIYEVSTVSEPLDNIDRILKEEPYKVFKSLIDHKNSTGEYAFKIYTEQSASFTEKYQKRMPDSVINAIYAKTYTSLAFSPLLENVYSEATGTYDPEKNGYTLFIPLNEVLDNFIKTKLLKYYHTVDELPLNVISTLINTHMVNGLVWPSLYESTSNASGEFLNGEGNNGKLFDEDGIVEKRVASNGFVFQTDHVIKSRFFETVYSEIFLNPAHTLLNQAYVNFYSTGIREDLMKSVLNGYSSERYAMLNFSDQLLQEDGFSYSALSNSFSNSLMSSGSSDDRLKRLMRMHIFSGLKNSEINSELTDFSNGLLTNYNGWNFTVNHYGDAVRYKNNQLQAAGNIEDQTFVTVTKVDDYNNGIVFNVDKLLQYSPRETGADDSRWQDLTLWNYLDRARKENPNVSLFVDYMERCLKNPDTDELDGIKPENYYTVLMPNNSAMQQAITRGYIQALASVNTSNAEALAQATKFVNGHILQGQVLVDDGNLYIYPANPMEPNRILIPTLLKITNETLDLTNERAFVEVTKTGTGLFNFLPMDITLGSKILVDGKLGTTITLRVQRGTVTGSTIPDNFRSNRIACKAILHEINNFFIFEEKQ